MLIKQTCTLIKNKNCIGRINISLHYKLYETRMIVISCLLLESYLFPVMLKHTITISGTMRMTVLTKKIISVL